MDRPFELVIFDCDGVLVDSERIAVRIDAMLLAELGWPLSEEEIVERFVGAGGLSKAEQLAGERTVVFHDMRELPALLRHTLPPG